MKSISITPKQIEISPEKEVKIPATTVTVESIQWSTSDDPFNRRLMVRVNNNLTFLVEGAEYDNLGQWDDDTIKNLILARYGLQEA